ncbi:MAG: Lrp/AsnC ligand binding domain-containing protein [Armatimonadetes bacterium]|nr:Lrp/AsnC ligand binding domain-containing protein [Armatimonadota bacterium]MDW8120863.1 Lrp/AsnC ligand binding domain-containing protein [Armatimonadota bacterium]
MAKAYVFVKVGVGSAERVAACLRQLPGVKGADVVGGISDIVAFVEANDAKGLSELVLTRIHAIEGVAETETRLIVEE